MEASALQAPASLPQTGVAMAAPLLRFRSDDQLVALFRAGHDEAFRAIHDRYHKRLFAYTRQMLHGRQDAEDALQDVFVRAYAGLRASDHELALRAWLFRVAHNRCIDELRRPAPPPPEVLQLVRSTVHDPLVEVDVRESLRRLIEDIRRLPEQQRSALLMRELAGMSYADLSASLGVSIGAVKSLLVRARVALAQAADARDTSCVLVREQLVEAHDHGIRPNANTRKHMRDCVGCKSFRRELRGMSRQLAAFSPAAGPLGILAKTLGFSGGGGGAAGGGGLALLGGGGVTASAGGVAVGINHVAALLVAAAATAGGAAAIQHTIVAPIHHPAHARVLTKRPHPDADTLYVNSSATAIQAIARAVEATVSTAPKLAATADAHKTVKASVRDPLGGGPVNAPATGAASLTASPRAKSTGASSGAAGLQSGSKSTSSSDPCSVASAADVSAVSTATTSTQSGSSSSTTGTPPAVAGAPVTSATEIPCLTPTSASTESTPSGADSSSAGTDSQTGGSTTTDSGTSSGASSTSTSGSASSSSSSSSSQSPSSGGGSATASK